MKSIFTIFALLLVAFSVYGQPCQSEEEEDQLTSCYINVILPVENAKVYINNMLTTSTGKERQYRSINVDPKRKYEYVIAVQYDNYAQTKTIVIKAGETFTIRFIGKSG